MNKQIEKIITDWQVRQVFCYNFCTNSLEHENDELWAAGPFKDHYHYSACMACSLTQRYHGEKKQAKAMRRIIRVALKECPELFKRVLEETFTDDLK